MTATIDYANSQLRQTNQHHDSSSHIIHDLPYNTRRNNRNSSATVDLQPTQVQFNRPSTRRNIIYNIRNTPVLNNDSTSTLTSTSTSQQESLLQHHYTDYEQVRDQQTRQLNRLTETLHRMQDRYATAQLLAGTNNDTTQTHLTNNVNNRSTHNNINNTQAATGLRSMNSRRRSRQNAVSRQERRDANLTLQLHHNDDNQQSNVRHRRTGRVSRSDRYQPRAIIQQDNTDNNGNQQPTQTLLPQAVHFVPQQHHQHQHQHQHHHHHHHHVVTLQQVEAYLRLHSTRIPAQAVINALPKILITNHNIDNNSDVSSVNYDYINNNSQSSKDNETVTQECSICLDDFDYNTYATQLPCNHLYHDICIRHWFTKSNQCPQCRYELDTDHHYVNQLIHHERNIQESKNQDIRLRQQQIEAERFVANVLNATSNNSGDNQTVDLTNSPQHTNNNTNNNNTNTVQAISVEQYDNDDDEVEILSVTKATQNINNNNTNNNNNNDDVIITGERINFDNINNTVQQHQQLNDDFHSEISPIPIFQFQFDIDQEYIDQGYNVPRLLDFDFDINQAEQNISNSSSNSSSDISSSDVTITDENNGDTTESDNDFNFDADHY